MRIMMPFTQPPPAPKMRARGDGVSGGDVDGLMKCRGHENMMLYIRNIGFDAMTN